MPQGATSKSKTSDVTLPNIHEDASERKRLLNVLAQRRYRQRKREHLKCLETQVKAQHVSTRTSITDETHSLDFRSLKTPGRDLTSNTSSVSGLEQLDQGLSTSSPSSNSDSPRTSAQCLQSQYTISPIYAGGTPIIPAVLPDFTTQYPEHWDFGSTDLPGADLPWDAFDLLPSLPNTPASLAEDFQTSTAGSSSSTSPSSFPSTNSDNTSVSQRRPVNHYFPDEANLQILELDILRAGHGIAERLNVLDLIWSPTSLSPYADPTLQHTFYEHLPLNLWPTKLQRTIPHHPMFDILPWPRVRDKLIMVFSQKPEIRPPIAATPTALFDLVYDIEDSAEGVRITGNDPFSEDNWEVGQKLFEGWWWAFDRDVLRRSNELRKKRGAPLLGEGRILGEIQ